MDTQILLALGVPAAGAVGYFIDRWLRRSAAHEDTESLVKTVELKRLLDSEGMSFEDAKALRDRLFSGREIITSKMVQAIQDGAVDMANRPLDFADTTLGMRLGMNNRLTELDGIIDFGMAELIQKFSEARQIALHEAHDAWIEFRLREAELAALAFEGGTGAPLLGAARMVELSEQRVELLEQIKAELEDRYG